MSCDSVISDFSFFQAMGMVSSNRCKKNNYYIYNIYIIYIIKIFVGCADGRGSAFVETEI